jgi:hypothetical protein
MAIREGMTELVARLRQLTRAADSEYTLSSVAYWTDDQLQDILDENRTSHIAVYLEAQSSRVDGAIVYLTFIMPESLKYVERAPSSGTSYFIVRDSQGYEPDDAYTVNYPAREITFTADQTSVSYYLDCRSFDLYNAAIQVLDGRIAFYSTKVDWQSDNHRISASQELETLRKLRGEYASLAETGFDTVPIVRIDEAPGRWSKRQHWTKF